MYTIALLAQKGGTGKTTLAVHMAADFEGAGGSAALIDLDPQASAALWGDRRGRSPFVGAVPTARLCTLASLPFAVVLNHVPPRGRTKDLAEAAVRDYGAAVAPARIGARAAFAHCLPLGLSVAEAYPRSKAAGEIRAFRAWLRQYMGD